MFIIYISLQIRDGNSSSDNLLGNLCGYQIPNPIFSYGNELWLKAKTINRGLGLYDIIYTSTDKGNTFSHLRIT